MNDSGQVYCFALSSVLNEKKCTVNEADFMSVQWTFIFKFHNVWCSVISLLLECRSAEECAGVCLFSPVSPFLSLRLTSTLSPSKRAGWYVSFPLGMAQIWQQLGLLPMQETHPTETNSCPFTYVCLCVCPLCHCQTPLNTNKMDAHVLNVRIYTVSL